MRRRKKLTKRKSKKLFSKTAVKVHRRNANHRIMRGGIRL